VRYFKYLPIRLSRFAFGIFNFKYFPVHNEIASKNPFIWFGDMIFLLLDILGIAEINEFFKSIFLSKQRLLNKKELELATETLLHNIDYKEVRINPGMNKYYRKLCIAFVSFNTVNYSGSLSKATFIHEMVHILQYQKFGSLYLFRAILAQAKSNTYDYGGVENLNKMMIKGASIYDFNFEQQAEIIEDYYKIMSGQIDTTPLVKSIFYYFYSQLIISKT
jgi:hypothetical protein